MIIIWKVRGLFIVCGFSRLFSPSIQDGEKEREKRDERIRSILKGDFI